MDPGEVIYYNNKSAAVFEKIKKSDSSDFSAVKDLCKKAIEIGKENGADCKNIAKAIKRIGTCYQNERDVIKGTEFFYILIIMFQLRSFYFRFINSNLNFHSLENYNKY